jgi:hypothetical protein
MTELARSPVNAASRAAPPDDALTAAVRELVGAARDRALDGLSRDRLADAVARLDQPLRLAIAGRVKAGKSTLLNALVGEELAPTDAGECTKLVTWYVGGHAARVTAVRRDGRREQRPFSREGGALEVDLGAPAEEFDHLEVSWPSSRLADVTLVDTPGIASLSTEVSERTSTLLSAEDDRPPAVDAVLYLFRHSHASDVRFLESFHDDELGRGTPLNAVGVLSRPDEIGSCRLDALTVAARVADRYERDPRIHRLCPLVLPVAGLLGQAGTTLREQEYRALATIAALPDEECNELLLTADRLLADDADTTLTPLERAHLADRLGLFGVRLSVALIRNGTVRSATDLAGRLAQDSALEELRGVLLRQFLQRSRLLRARSALATVRAVLRRGGCAEPERLAARVEEVMGAAHEFVEVRLLTDLRTGTVAVAERLEAEMDRLLGGSGHSVARRLGLPEDASVAQRLDSAYAALERWRRVESSPLTGREARIAAQGVVRTCEGMVAGLVPARP